MSIDGLCPPSDIFIYTWFEDVDEWLCADIVHNIIFPLALDSPIV